MFILNRFLIVACVLLLKNACLQGEPERPGGEVLPEYTAENPGRWEKLAPSHLPEIKFSPGINENDEIHIRLQARHFGKDHYIEKIGLVNIKTKKELAAKIFMRESTDFSAIFPYNYNDAEIKVFVKCNLHDAWTVTDVGRFR